jgi:hypothetical protein
MLYYERFYDHVVVFPLYFGYWCITVASKGESFSTLLVSVKSALVAGSLASDLDALAVSMVSSGVKMVFVVTRSWCSLTG